MKKQLNLLSNYLITVNLCIIALTSCTDSSEPFGVISDTIQTKTIEPLYYWHHGEKILLELDTQKTFILYDEATVRKASDYLNSEIVLASGSAAESFGQSRHIPESLSNSYKWAILLSNEQTINALKDDPIIYYGRFFKERKTGLSIGCSNLVYVKIRADKDFQTLSEMAEKEGAAIVKQNKFFPKWYTLDCSSSSLDALELANLLYESGIFDAVQPDWLYCNNITQSITDDHFSNQQWNLHNYGQTGVSAPLYDINFSPFYCDSLPCSQDVIVAVIDDGIQLNHPDLTLSNISYDAHTDTSPSIVRSPHGTACAGIIGAIANNSIGIAGVASGCSLMSISHNASSLNPNSAQELADAFGFAIENGASVISCSWTGLPSSQILEDAINTALEEGRDGKGCIVVFSAGNDDLNTIPFPSNSNDDILVVGGMDYYGQRVNLYTWGWGSNYGVELDIVAPAVNIPTTDITGSDGYYPIDYYLSFDGTSAACPHVAGVAARILSSFPDLSQQDVCKYILENTTKLEDYTIWTNRTYGTWNDNIGYGLLNAQAAFSAAIEDNIPENSTLPNNWNYYIIQNQTFYTDTLFNEEAIQITNVSVNPAVTLSLTSLCCLINDNFSVDENGYFFINN